MLLHGAIDMIDALQSKPVAFSTTAGLMSPA